VASAALLACLAGEAVLVSKIRPMLTAEPGAAITLSWPSYEGRPSTGGRDEERDRETEEIEAAAGHDLLFDGASGP
jgi:hypothetical protein